MSGCALLVLLDEERRGLLLCAERYNLVKELGLWADFSRENDDFVYISSKCSSCSRKRRKSFRWFVLLV